MSIIRKLTDKIELYDPRTGEPFLHYDENNDKVVADKPLEAKTAGISNTVGYLESTTNQTITNASVTKVEWDSVRIDESVVSVSTTNNNIEIQETGDYLVNFYYYFESDSGWSTGDPINVRVFTNGSSESRVYHPKVSTTEQSIPITAYLPELRIGDVVDIRIFQESGSAKDLIAVNTRNEFSVTKVA